jgi:hypothetical protein
LGSKNRIYLGIITSQILHHFRNVFSENKLVVSKKKAQKIKNNHPLQAQYIYEYTFQELLNTTVATCNYKENGIMNFITFNGEYYLIYGISINNYHNELTTIFKPSIRQLTKCKKSIKFFSEKMKVEFEDFIKN